MTDLTSESTLAVRRGTTGDWADLSDQAAGVSGWNDTVTARNRVVPSIAPVLVTQLMSVSDGNVNFTIDDNADTHGLFFMQSGEQFQVRIRPQGDGSGKAQALHTGIMAITLNNAEGGARTFQCSLTTTTLDKADQ